MGQRRFIRFKVEDELPEDVSLRLSRGAVREPARERFRRCLRFSGFCCVCTCTLFQALAPWMLSAIEVVTLLLLLLLLVVPTQPPGPYTFNFHASLEDLVLLGGLRAAAICGTYAYGSSSFHFRPYLYTSYVTGCAGLLYVLPKACLYAYPLRWLPPAALMVMFGTFSWLHILAARYTVTWYRRRGQLGLLQGPLLPQQQRTAAGGGGFRRSVSRESLPATSPAWLDDSQADLPAELLADPDSRFMDVDGLIVHYKEAAPAAWFAGGVGYLQQQQQQASDVSAAAAAGVVAGGDVLLEPPATHVGMSVTAAAEGEGAGVAVADAAGSSSGQQQLSSDGGQHLQPPQVQVQPPPSAAAADVAVVLVHGFCGGVFAFRHIMQQLADELGVRVVAFDRPGFGLTARPDAGANSQSGEAQPQQPQQPQQPSSSIQEPLLPTHQQPHSSRQQQQQQPSDPYSFPSQAQLTLRFCELLGLRRVLLVAHADGCVVAAYAAALACQHKQPPQPASMPPGVAQPVDPGSSQQSSTSAAAQQPHNNSTGGSSSSSSGSDPAPRAPLQVLGLALLHPNLGSGNQVPAFTKLLASSSLGRSMLRPLLRSEVGVVSARRAWHNPELMTPEVLALYKRPLRVQGWDAALVASSSATARLNVKQVLGQFAAVRDLPALLVAGEFDRIAPSHHASALAAVLTRMKCGVVSACGHLSHEEAPQQLLALLLPFCAACLQQ